MMEGAGRRKRHDPGGCARDLLPEPSEMGPVRTRGSIHDLNPLNRSVTSHDEGFRFKWDAGMP